MSEKLPGWAFYDRQIAALEACDIEKIMAQYHEDAVLVTFDRTVRGLPALREHFVNYLDGLGSIKLVSTDRFTETPEAVFFEATVRTAAAEVKVYDVFMLRDGRATYHFSGLISFNPLSAHRPVPGPNAGAKERNVTHHDELTRERINEFVAAWYLALDQHVPAEQCGDLVSDNVEMIFPEKTLHGKSDFLAWYAGGTYADGEKAPGVINIFFDENHNVVSVDAKIWEDSAELDVVVAWQASMFIAPAAKSKRVSLDATQKWTVCRSDKNPYGIEVSSYNAMAEPFKYAPGFARL